MLSYRSLIAGLVLLTLILGACKQEGTVVSEEVKVEGGDTTAQSLSLDFTEIELKDATYLVFRQELSLQDVPGFLAIEADSLNNKANRGGVKAAGPMTSLFYVWEPETGTADAAVALPVEKGTKLSPYVSITLPDGPALALTMDGPYDRLSAFHYALSAELQTRGYKPVAPSIEEYIVGPLETRDAQEFKTRIIYPYTK
ncbi:hypothetical protein A3850_013450 [Lewinella sp. 4G2]|nr:hypothetical protein A3850_013450 [Lewinella sp. 4G2]